MVATPHMLIGAAVASRTRSAKVAVGLAVLAHLLADTIPHTEYSPDTYGGALLAADLLVGLLAVAVLCRRDLRLWAGAAGGALPDVLSVAERHLGTSLTTGVHGWIHTDISWPFWPGVITQLTAVAFAVAVIVTARPAPRRHVASEDASRRDAA